jgi:twitching motility two-component system response regulator PilH
MNTLDGSEPPQAKPVNNGTLPKVLYVEGHSTLRDLLCQLLAGKGHYALRVAPNGLEGVREAHAWRPDVILMGLRMPVMDGYQAIEMLRRSPATAHIPIIVLSAWDSATCRQRTSAAGANEHLSPPVEMDRLIHKIDWYLALAGRKVHP